MTRVGISQKTIEAFYPNQTCRCRGFSSF